VGAPPYPPDPTTPGKVHILYRTTIEESEGIIVDLLFINDKDQSYILGLPLAICFKVRYT
jgi:hypothetical protein